MPEPGDRTSARCPAVTAYPSNISAYHSAQRLLHSASASQSHLPPHAAHCLVLKSDGPSLWSCSISPAANAASQMSKRCSCGSACPGSGGRGGSNSKHLAACLLRDVVCRRSANAESERNPARLPNNRHDSRTTHSAADSAVRIVQPFCMSYKKGRTTLLCPLCWVILLLGLHTIPAKRGLCFPILLL